MFFIDYASEEERKKISVTLENLWRRFVCARLYCRKCTLTKFFFFSPPQSVLYLGDSVEVLEKCWGFPPRPPPQEDIQEVSDERLALNPQCNAPLPMSAFRSMR